MPTIQLPDHIKSALLSQGFERKVVLPVKMLSSIDAVLNTALPKSVVGIMAVINPETNYCERLKDIVLRIRPNAYAMCLFNDMHPSNIVSIYYK
ncbi:hypothetical protein DFR87_11140 [Metallosphaera hakonensis JCM 8857 = DSM 7519]|uniref:Uncharacterized protein n=1 Tax=Metallosphaera hakonensis JCM 8857 = DSM 7519 TaxID=1293036 RepID=A0A2U9IVU2_9CREN|nr:hypothetical protein DFR87_11140 [Metallosphaera hakonensis JCM 8857 = DSM 7519]